MQPANENISVVVQGPVFGRPGDPAGERWTRLAIESVRKVLPGAEVVLSTWKGSDLSDLRADLVVENEDPGAASYFGKEAQNNVNRQIVSTLAGIKTATRPYVLKIRSETVLAHDGFRRFFGRFPLRCAAQVVGERVVASTLSSYVPREVSFHSCYSPSDWFHFGLRADVLDIWDVPLAPEPATTLWFTTHPFPAAVKDSPSKLRYSIEQYIWVAFLRKHHPVEFDSLWEIADETVRASEESLAANLVLVSPRHAGLHSLKYPASATCGVICHVRRGCYSHQHWRALYERYCGERRFRATAWYPPFFRGARCAIRAFHHLRSAPLRLS